MFGFMKSQISKTALFVAGLIIVATIAILIFKPSLRLKIKYWIHYFSAPKSVRALGDGGKSADLRLYDPMGIAEDAYRNVYITDRGRKLSGGVIWKIDPRGSVTAIAGTGRRGAVTGGVHSLSSNLGSPEGLCLDRKNRIYFVDSKNHVVLKIADDGQLVRIAGTGNSGYGGDGGPPVEAELNKPYDVRIDGQDALYIADVMNHRIRRIAPDGVITTVAGTGEPGYSGDHGPATLAALNTPYGVCIDKEGRLLIADSENHVIRRVDSTGLITTIAGIGEAGYSGDGGPASAAAFNSPQALWIDNSARLYVGDEHNHAIRVIRADGMVTTLAGTGQVGYADDGDLATGAPLNDPENILVRGDGSVLITDGDNGRVLIVGLDGRVRKFAGRGLSSSR